ncbi:DUF1499 domain-containing protein [Marinimicrobium sp. C6131]|uniref:DUF1499 domain-containing protein n=1 Tax=Marinimicrobium sp. C6131 TaxID=3022676 RepID=UPI00223E0D26|nr:DUF1499 domain-containing protein [Marinimicrobium sp. C6131]UZJ44549.1 DUF1499 domain-containing protein [Marinimicrobium sp. C6131]
MKKLLGIIALLSGFAALFLVFIAGPSFRNGWLDLGQAFTLLRWGAYVGIASVPLIIGYAIWRKPEGRFTSALAISAVVGLFSFYLPFSQWQTAQSVPPIHDITTDLDNPPAFVAILPLREGAPNPPEYAGEDTAKQQREAYPDLQPLIVEQPVDDVFEAAKAVVEGQAWDLAGAERLDDGSARVEATDTTLWFGFKDDVVVRIQPHENGSRVDVRSKSRLGRSDVGANARRIELFMEKLQDELK